MSYILDALKKLEKEKKKGLIPGLSEQDSIVYHSRKRSPFLYAFLGIAAVLAFIAAWWMASQKQSGRAVVSYKSELPEQKNDLLQSQPKAVPVDAQAKLSQPNESTSVNNVVKVESIKLPGNTVETEMKKTGSVSESRQSDQQDKKTAAAVIPEEKKAEPVVEPMPEKKLYKISELPASIKADLPGFSITAFLYSAEPSGRMARINERMMKEGQMLGAGIRVEEILPDGVIISYKKFRIFIAVN